MPGIQKAVDFLINIANDDSHGYDQAHRTGPDYDCSSLTAAALRAGGFDINKDSWTGNLYLQLLKAGFKPCTAPWKAGDIHLKVGKHVNVSINATQVVNASSNEKGKATGGITGDQTGREICIKNYYEYSGGWDYHLRYQPIVCADMQQVVADVLAGKYGNGDERRVKLAAAGYDYAKVQAAVNATNKTTPQKSIDEIAKEVVNGKWGNGAERKQRLEAAGYNYTEVQQAVNRHLRG